VTGLVLVHGGQHAGDCWEPTVDRLRHRSPRTPVLAVDLPGRRAAPGDLSTVTVADWVDAAVAQIEAAGLDQVVVVGHSMAGLTVPGVVTRLGADRVRRMILIAAAVPPAGHSIVETLRGPLGWYARRAARRGAPTLMPRALAAASFCNGMTRAQRRFTLDRLYPESTRVVAEPADRSALPGDVPRTWILTRRDRAQSPRTQRRAIESLGGVDEVVELDTCHDAMISAPDELAAILLDRCPVGAAHRPPRSTPWVRKRLTEGAARERRNIRSGQHSPYRAGWAEG
jgi:pimeloyl-ACP methyl ester carboxylesterase